MNGAICSELLTRDGWNPINDIESVIVSIRSLLVVGNGRLESVADLPSGKRQELLAAALNKNSHGTNVTLKDDESEKTQESRKRKHHSDSVVSKAGEYSALEAYSAYQHLSEYHKKAGWDRSGWWAKKG
jgi:ubiquitin-conjugating enzyme E2 Q